MNRSVFTLFPVALSLALLLWRGGTAAAQDRPVHNTPSESGLALDSARSVQFTTDEGTKLSPDVSPDGETIVFALLGDLYTMPIDGGTATQLTSGMAVDYRPRWSPDGNRIAFVSDRSGTGNVWVIDADGSDPYNVTQQDPDERPKSVRFFMMPEWTPDGDHIVVSINTEATNLYRLHDIYKYPAGRDAEGGGRSVFAGDVPRDLRKGVEPQFGPKGRFLYYDWENYRRFDGEKMLPWFQIKKYDTRTGKIYDITDASLGAFTPSLSPNGKWMVYASRHEADTGLRLRNRRTGADQWLLYPVDRDRVNNWVYESITSDCSWLPDSRSFVTSFDGKLWRVDVPSGEYTKIPFEVNVERALAPLNRPRHQVNEDPRVRARTLRSVVPSPNGERLAFTTFDRVWVAGPDGDARRVTDGGIGSEFDPTWSPDGQSLVFATFKTHDDSGHLYRASADGTGNAERLTSVPGYYRFPTYVPEGDTLVFTRAPINDDLYYDGTTDGSIQRLAVEGNGRPTLVTPIQQNVFPVRPQVISAVPNRVYYRDPDAGLVSVRLDGSEYREHFEIGLMGFVNPWDSPTAASIRLRDDGQYALVEANDSPARAMHTMLVDLRGIDLRSEKQGVVSAKHPKKSLPYRRLSPAHGGFEPFWSADGTTAHFMMADHVFGYDLSGTPMQDTARATERRTIDASLPRKQTDEVLALRGARLITMNGDQVIENGDVVIGGDTVRAVGPRGSVPIPETATVMDMSGKTIMPGMIDTHAHSAYLASDNAPPPTHEWTLLNRLAYGVTTMHDPYHSIAQFDIADQIRAGKRIGPRIFGTGPAMDETAFAYTLDDSRTLARRQSDYFRGKLLKSYNIGGRVSRQWLVKAAREQGVTAIIENDAAQNYALSAIIDGYSHLAHGLAAPMYEDVRKLLAASGTSVNYQFGTLRGEGGPSSPFYFLDHELDYSNERLRVTTPQKRFIERDWRRLTVNDRDHVFPYYSTHISKMIDAGVTVGLGDHAVFHGIGMQWEVWALSSNMDNHKALRVATLDGYRTVGLASEFGSLEPGKYADLIVLDGNPLDEIRDLAKVTYTLVDGVLYEAESLRTVWPKKQSLSPDPWWWDSAPPMREGAERSGGVEALKESAPPK